MPDHDTSRAILDLFTELLDAPAPSGREFAMADLVRAKLSAWGYEQTTDGAGNVMVRVPGRQPDAPLCCFAAHMDEIGMVVTRVEEDGSLRVDRSGGLYPWKLGEGPVQILGDHRTITGLLSMGSTHTSAAEDRGVRWSDVRVLTGLSSAQLAAAGVRPGSTAVPVRNVRGPILFGDESDPLVAAWTFDDRLGVAILLKMLETLKQERLQPFHPTLVAFTVHEEGGGQGAKMVAQRERPQIFIAVDGCPMPPGAPLSLDGRPGIWSKDRLTHYDQRLVQAVAQAAQSVGTEIQPVVYEQAASDASLVYYAGAAERIACFGHVRENSHGYEVVRLSVMGNLFNTLMAFIRHWTGE
jgi:putative aminopeptidase FrvX